VDGAGEAGRRVAERGHSGLPRLYLRTFKVAPDAQRLSGFNFASRDGAEFALIIKIDKS
jgi:hypothetical protein